MFFSHANISITSMPELGDPAMKILIQTPCVLGWNALTGLTIVLKQWSACHAVYNEEYK